MHGHINLARNHLTLGSWCSKQWFKFKNRKLRKPLKLTDEREAAFGRFVFFAKLKRKLSVEKEEETHGKLE